MIIGLFYLICIWLDPFIYAFSFSPLLDRRVSNFSHTITYVLVFDAIVTLFTGIRKEDDMQI